MNNKVVISLTSGISVSTSLPLILSTFFSESKLNLFEYLFAFLYVMLFVMTYGLLVSLLAFKIASLRNVRSTGIRFLFMTFFGFLPYLIDHSLGYGSTIASIQYFCFNEVLYRIPTKGHQSP